MTTEEQFTTAMRAAVAERGSDWSYPKYKDVGEQGGWYHMGVPTYSNQAGEGTCLIGRAMELAGMAVPSLTAGGAYGVLYDKVPLSVAVAARSAQMHQDYSKPWGEALAIYGWVVENYDPHVALNDVYFKACEALSIKPALPEFRAVPAGITLSFNMEKAMADADKAMKELTKSLSAQVMAVNKVLEEANATVAQPITDKVPYFPVGTVSTTMPIVGLAKGGIVTNPYATGGPILQKDHALVA